MVQPAFELIRELLLGVLRPGAPELILPIGDIAGRGGHLEPIVQRCQVCG